MYRTQRNRPTPSNSAARLAAEAAFSAPPAIERAPEVSNALIVVKKKRLIDPAAIEHGEAHETRETQGHETHHAPRVFRVPTQESPTELKPAQHEDDHQQDVPRRLRRAVTRPSPVVTVVPPAPPVDLAALSRELEAAMTAREHAAAEAQLNRLEAQLSELDSVLSQIAKARDFSLLP